MRTPAAPSPPRLTAPRPPPPTARTSPAPTPTSLRPAHRSPRPLRRRRPLRYGLVIAHHLFAAHDLFHTSDVGRMGFDCSLITGLEPSSFERRRGQRLPRLGPVSGACSSSDEARTRGGDAHRRTGETRVSPPCVRSVEAVSAPTDQEVGSSNLSGRLGVTRSLETPGSTRSLPRDASGTDAPPVPCKLTVIQPPFMLQM
jgi:hypothetical protein